MIDPHQLLTKYHILFPNLNAVLIATVRDEKEEKARVRGKLAITAASQLCTR